MTRLHSEQWFKKAQDVIPGGVNSPVRAFRGVGGDPVFFKAGIGPYLIDEDDNHYIDYIGSWGPLILGHCHPVVQKALENTIKTGTSFGAPTVLEVKLAEKIVSQIPSIEKVRLVNSGTEATMTAIRLARGYTRRDKIIKFNGCYHGHHDALLAKAGSGLLTLGIPSTPGVPERVTADTLLADFNHLDQVSDWFQTYPSEIAAVIIEPIAGNMGFVLPSAGFLEGLRALCTQYGALLIFDEVMTGFRVALGGAQSLYGVTPDLTTLGKVIGGGLPVGALGGKKEVMDALAPSGQVYQAGTLSGNPLAVAAGLATLTEIEVPGFYENLSAVTQKLVTGMIAIAETHHIPFWADSRGGMFGFCFNAAKNIQTLEDVRASDETLFRNIYHQMLDQGIYLAPSMYEAGFVSSQHTEKEVQMTLDAFERACAKYDTRN